MTGPIHCTFEDIALYAIVRGNLCAGISNLKSWGFFQLCVVILISVLSVPYVCGAYDNNQMVEPSVLKGSALIRASQL